MLTSMISPAPRLRNAAQNGDDGAGGDARRGLDATIGLERARPNINIRHTADLASCLSFALLGGALS